MNVYILLYIQMAFSAPWLGTKIIFHWKVRQCNKYYWQKHTSVHIGIQLGRNMGRKKKRGKKRSMRGGKIKKKDAGIRGK